MSFKRLEKPKSFWKIASVTDSETDSVKWGVSDRRGFGEGFWLFV